MPPYSPSCIGETGACCDVYGPQVQHRRQSIRMLRDRSSRLQGWRMDDGWSAWYSVMAIGGWSLPPPRRPRRHIIITNFSTDRYLLCIPSISCSFPLICVHYFIPLLVAYRRLCGGCYSQLVLTLLVRDEASPTTEKTTALGHRSTRQQCLPVPTVGLSPAGEHCVNWLY
jgi:hypothetical protein